MVRIMNRRRDAKTHFYTGGDERTVSKDREPVPPGVPAALGGKFTVQEVKLPTASWYPGLKTFVRKEETEKRVAACGVAADEFAPTNPDDLVATGFVVRNFFRWNYNNWMRDNVEHTAKAFLCLTLNCWHCHDHKYDPISQEEYFKFRAIF